MTAREPGLVPRIAPKARLAWDETRGRYVLLYPEGLVALNATGAEILKLCDGNRSLDDIVKELAQRYSKQEIRDDVAGFLERLSEKGLITYGC